MRVTLHRVTRSAWRRVASGCCAGLYAGPALSFLEAFAVLVAWSLRFVSLAGAIFATFSWSDNRQASHLVTDGSSSSVRMASASRDRGFGLALNIRHVIASLGHDQVKQLLCFGGIKRLEVLVDNQRLILLASQ